MTRDETIKLLMVIQSAYPNFKPPDKTVAVDTWYTMLKDMDYNVVQMGLRAYITTDTSGFAPSIGRLINTIYTIQNPQELNEMEAWALVSKALKNGYYGAVEEFDSLPPLVQKAVGNPDNLRNWSQTDTNSIENVVQSNFMRSYRLVVNRENEIKKMPADVRTLIENVNKTSYSAQIGAKNQQTIKLSFEDNKSQNKPIKGIPMPKEIKERIEQMKR
ncbi:replicative helicase loader/inhibitor [Agathobacter rectalis]|nr:replicative helicase loader/inhibitor [Agathobacter rectalis]